MKDANENNENNSSTSAWARRTCLDFKRRETTWRTPRLRQPPSSDFATWGSCKMPYTRPW